MEINDFYNVMPEEIILSYKYENDDMVECSMNFEDDSFNITYKGVEVAMTDNELLFHYSTCGQYLKDNLEIKGAFEGVTCDVISVNSDGDTVEYQAFYINGSLETGEPESFTGTQIFVNTSLVAQNNVILLYDVFNIADLKSKILDMIR